jgi:aminoglycoside phosphotransferase (APT) family kinase protein
MRISDARDLEAIRDGFTRWLRARFPAGAAIEVAPIGRPDAGLSAETLFIEADVSGAGAAPGRHLSFVVRVPPTGDALFEAYDFAGQASVQAHLAGAGIPAVTPTAVEADPSWLGAPFLLMERVPGRTLRNDAPFLRQGWLAEAEAGDQARLHANLLDVLARLHRLRWDDLGWDDAGIGFLLGGTESGEGVDPDGPVLAATLARWARYLAWAGEGSVPPALDGAVAWCRANLPASEPPPSVLWGDVQFGNMVIADDMSIAAILDFELASVGPAELDVSWFLVLHSMTVASCGGDLPGFPGRAETLARYERLLGRPLDDLRWYEVFAALRTGAIMVRAARLLTRLGIDDTWLTDANPTIELIGELTAD